MVRVFVQDKDDDKTAVQALIADADRALALIDLDEVRGNREIVEIAVANAHRNYIDLVRRSRPLRMSDPDRAIFQRLLDGLKARLRVFGESI